MTSPLHILFFPFMAAGHTIPTVDMAKLFASHGVRITILTTPVNATVIRPNLLRHPSVTLHIIPFPTADAGLPDGCEDLAATTSLELRTNFHHAVSMLKVPFAQVLRTIHPDCIVTDVFLPWTAEIAEEHDIPRIEFHGTSFFALCATATDMVERHNSTAESATVMIPHFPHKIEMLRSQIQDKTKIEPGRQEVFKLIKLAEAKTYGVLVNSFYELEPDYADHFGSIIGRRAWHVGPALLCNESESDRASRRGDSSSAGIAAEACLSWLDNWPSRSVVYVCFGSVSSFTKGQLTEMALGLEASGHPFIWVVRKAFIPEGFQDRVKDMGLIIRGWAPQMAILEHDSVGAFVTHCGWNSVLEGVSAGLPMVTWPLYAEQFFNERLVVEVLGIGVAVGASVHTLREEERPLLEAGKVEKAVREIMKGGEVAKERRRKARELREKARTAVAKEGSSYWDVVGFIKEMMERRGKGKKCV